MFRSEVLAMTKTKVKPTTEDPPKLNRYAGPCVECGIRVEEGMGHIVMSSDGKWRVQHPPQTCPSWTEGLELAK